MIAITDWAGLQGLSRLAKPSGGAARLLTTLLYSAVGQASWHRQLPRSGWRALAGRIEQGFQLLQDCVTKAVKLVAAPNMRYIGISWLQCVIDAVGMRDIDLADAPT